MLAVECRWQLEVFGKENREKLDRVACTYSHYRNKYQFCLLYYCTVLQYCRNTVGTLQKFCTVWQYYISIHYCWRTVSIIFKYFILLTSRSTVVMFTYWRKIPCQKQADVLVTCYNGMITALLPFSSVVILIISFMRRVMMWITTSNDPWTMITTCDNHLPLSYSLKLVEFQQLSHQSS